jgi:hypothetical protein
MSDESRLYESHSTWRKEYVRAMDRLKAAAKRADAAEAVTKTVRDWAQAVAEGNVDPAYGARDVALHIVRIIDAALNGTEGPCGCGGFDRNASHSAGEYVSYCDPRNHSIEGER